MAPFFLGSLGLAACGTAPLAVDAGAEPAGDTAAPVDTGDDPPPTPLRFLVGEGLAGSTLVLTWADPASFVGPAPTFGGVLVSSAVAGTELPLTPPEPAAAELAEVDPERFPGLLAAAYVAGTFVDTDGDGLRSGAEAWLGVCPILAVYAAGDVPESSGLVAGWNARLVVPGGDILAADAQSLPLSANLAVTATATLAGTAAAPDGLRLALVAAAEAAGGADLPDLWGGPASASWAVTVEGPPPAAHTDAAGGALEALVAFRDLDGDEAFGPGDTLVAPATAAGEPAGLRWAPAPTELSVAFRDVLLGDPPGWAPVALASPDVPLSEEAATTLAVAGG